MTTITRPAWHGVCQACPARFYDPEDGSSNRYQAGVHQDRYHDQAQTIFWSDDDDELRPLDSPILLDSDFDASGTWR